MDGAPARKIGHAHLAFYRGYLNGLNLKLLAERYLEQDADLRVAKSTLAWIRDELCRAAIRHGRHGVARLIRTPITRSPESSNVGTVQENCANDCLSSNVGTPTLDDYRKTKDPSGFYSESELLELFLEDYPVKHDTGNSSNLHNLSNNYSRSAKAERLRRRQTEALVWIEGLLATDPSPEDPIASWFAGDSGLPAAIKETGLETIGDLMAHINRKGYRWWTDIPKLGETGASKVVAWLDSHSSTLGKLAKKAFVPESQLSAADVARPASFGIAPIEALSLPDEYGGGAALQRARNWISAIPSPNTQRAYRREVERLLLWAAFEAETSVFSLGLADLDRYREWLLGLGKTPVDAWPWKTPQAEWFAPRNTKRWSPSWRPFDGPLSDNSIKAGIDIAKAFLRAHTGKPQKGSH